MQLSARVAASHPPSRLRVALAAAWLIASLAIGGVIGAESSADQIVAPTRMAGTAAQP
jgi:2-phospho-L-lactate guanylyltransferase (CobY/MobA/RfbA family)